MIIVLLQYFSQACSKLNSTYCNCTVKRCIIRQRWIVCKVSVCVTSVYSVIVVWLLNASSKYLLSVLNLFFQMISVNHASRPRKRKADLQEPWSSPWVRLALLLMKLLVFDVFIWMCGWSGRTEGHSEQHRSEVQHHSE